MLLEQNITNGFDALGLPLDVKAISSYRIYFEYLEKMNKVMNLTAISGEDNVAKLHFLDCVQLLKYKDFAGKRVIDVGTGAGFPGLPLKIACSDMQLTLLDSLDKRINFLRETSEKLGLEDTVCIHARAEDAPKAYRESFDIALSRAVARLNLLCELCLPLVKVGGVFMAMKGPDCEDELNEAKKGITMLGGKVEAVHSYNVPLTDVTHSVVIIKKEKETPSRFPRRWAQIKKQPL